MGYLNKGYSGSTISADSSSFDEGVASFVKAWYTGDWWFVQ